MKKVKGNYQNKSSVKKYAKTNFKDIKVSTIKVVAGSMIVARVAMGPKKKEINSVSKSISIITQVNTPNQYIVEEGDDLLTIYLKTGVKVDKLIKLNNLQDKKVYQGQILNLS